MKEITFRLKLRIIKVAPDGKACVGCGDACFLSQFYYCVKVIGVTKFIKVAPLCNSCKDQIDDN